MKKPKSIQKDTSLPYECIVCEQDVHIDEAGQFLDFLKICKKHTEEIEMKPKARDHKEFVAEPVPCDEFLGAVISDVKYEEAHAFTGQFARVGEAVRIVFTLDPINGKAFEFPKSSRWMSFNYDQKSNLFKNYIFPLVKGAKPYMDFDVTKLKGVRCRLMFEESQNDDGKKFYNISIVKPEKGTSVDPLPTIQLDHEDSQETPF